MYTAVEMTAAIRKANSMSASTLRPNDDRYLGLCYSVWNLTLSPVVYLSKEFKKRLYIMLRSVHVGCVVANSLACRASNWATFSKMHARSSSRVQPAIMSFSSKTGLHVKLFVYCYIYYFLLHPSTYNKSRALSCFSVKWLWMHSCHYNQNWESCQLVSRTLHLARGKAAIWDHLRIESMATVSYRLAYDIKFFEELKRLNMTLVLRYYTVMVFF